MNKIKYAIYTTDNGNVVQLGETVSELSFDQLIETLPKGYAAFEYADRNVEIGMIYHPATDYLEPKQFPAHLAAFEEVTIKDIKDNQIIIMQALAEIYEKLEGK